MGPDLCLHILQQDKYCQAPTFWYYFHNLYQHKIVFSTVLRFLGFKFCIAARGSSQRTWICSSDIFVVSNYTSEWELEPVMDVLNLSALRQMLWAADDFVEDLPLEETSRGFWGVEAWRCQLHGYFRFGYILEDLYYFSSPLSYFKMKYLKWLTSVIPTVWTSQAVSLPSSVKMGFAAWDPGWDWLSIVSDQMWSLIISSSFRPYTSTIIDLTFQCLSLVKVPLNAVWSVLGRGVCLSCLWPQILVLCVFSLISLCIVHTALFQSKIRQKYQSKLKSYFSLWEIRVSYHL